MEHEVWSFFSGAMGLDLGLETAGLKPTLAVEFDKWCCDSIRKNRPEVSLIEGDVRLQSGERLRRQRKFDGDVFAMVGGPPCQSFSTGGKRAGLSDPRGNLIYEYLRLISEVKPGLFVLENVANLITAPLSHRPIKERPGQKWNLSSYSTDSGPDDGKAALRPDEMAGSAIRQILRDIEELGYDFQFKVVDASHYGAAQKRLRFLLIGARNGQVPSLPRASHGTASSDTLELVPLREVIYDLRLNPGPHSSYTSEVARFFELIPPGGYWKNLPEDLQKEALGTASFAAGGGKTGFFRRLSYDLPAPTVTTKPNRKGSAMCHPEFVRPISVRECARIQGFPDSWEFSGAMNQQYQQIGNAVPTHLGAAVGAALLAYEKSRGARTKSPSRLEVEIMLTQATTFLRSYARNRVNVVKEPDLFTAA
jgi:DNA (cytosine-5)-methyltransferase 1